MFVSLFVPRITQTKAWATANDETFFCLLVTFRSFSCSLVIDPAHASSTNVQMFHETADCGPRCQTYHTAGEADATQPRADIIPHPNAAPSDPLSHCELKEEQRDADQYQQDEIGHQVGSCQGVKKEQRVRGSEPCHQITAAPFQFLQACGVAPFLASLISLLNFKPCALVASQHS